MWPGHLPLLAGSSDLSAWSRGTKFGCGIGGSAAPALSTSLWGRELRCGLVSDAGRVQRAQGRRKSPRSRGRLRQGGRSGADLGMAAASIVVQCGYFGPGRVRFSERDRPIFETESPSCRGRTCRTFRRNFAMDVAMRFVDARPDIQGIRACHPARAFFRAFARLREGNGDHCTRRLLCEKDLRPRFPFHVGNFVLIGRRRCAGRRSVHPSGWRLRRGGGGEGQRGSEWDTRPASGPRGSLLMDARALFVSAMRAGRFTAWTGG